MQFVIKDVGQQVQVLLSGPMTVRDAPALSTVIQAMDEPWVQEMVVDMTAVSSMDHAALGAVRLWVARAHHRAIPLRLDGLSGELRQRLDAALPGVCLAAE